MTNGESTIAGWFNGKSMKILFEWMIWRYPDDLGNLHIYHDVVYKKQDKKQDMKIHISCPEARGLSETQPKNTNKID
jgi:hypothetical protein